MAESGRGAIALYNGYVVAEILRRRLPPSSRVLDFGEGRGLVEAHLASHGMTVERWREEDPRPEAPEGAYAAAFAEASDWLRVRTRASRLPRRLRPGALLLVRLRRRPGQSAARVFADLGPAFSWTHVGALGLLVPGEERSEWAARYPQLFGALCAAEGALRSLPGLCRGGLESLLLGTRRTEGPG
jgi:hypothetical protein